MKKPNHAGVFDVMGNVSEMCSDFYLSHDYQPASRRKRLTLDAGGDYLDPTDIRMRYDLSLYDTNKLVKGINAKDRDPKDSRLRQAAEAQRTRTGFRVVRVLSKE